LEARGSRAGGERENLKMGMVVYLLDQPFDDRNYERFGIERWLQRNWAVEVWDLTPWAYPDVWCSFIDCGKTIRRFAGYFPINSGKELASKIGASGRIDYFIDLTGESYHTARAKLRLMRIGAVRVVCELGSIPAPDRDANLDLLSRSMKVLAKGPRGAFRWMSNAFFGKVVAPHLASGWTIAAGEKSVDLAKHSRRIIWAHNFDYDIYLNLLKSISTSSEPYAVFIDQDYCFHPEYVCQGIVPLITPERYFPALCNAFREISSALKLQIRVAAHPRATYKERGLDCFAGFPIEYGGTAELISGCRVAMCHDSTAIQFAVLFRKPLIFLTTDELNRSPEGRSIAKMAAELGKSPINLDRDDLRGIDWQREVHVDAERYDSYVRRYVKARGSREAPVWEIVIDELETAESDAADC
jgi:hypothetical protein